MTALTDDTILPRRPDIEEYKRLVRAFDELPKRTKTFVRLEDEEDPRYKQYGDAILNHPLDKRGSRYGGINTIALARSENEREAAGDPYWGVPHFDVEVIEDGYEVDVTYPSPGIKVSSDKTDYGKEHERLTRWGVERLKKRQRKRWDRHCRRLIELGVYDKEVGWPDADD
jgi:hypothetical protein